MNQAHRWSRREFLEAAILGGTGAVLGLIGGIIVSLFVDSLYGWLAGSLDSEVSIGRQLVAPARARAALARFPRR